MSALGVIRVLIGDNRPLVRDTLGHALDHLEGFEVVGRADSCEEAAALASRLKPAVVLYGIVSCEMDVDDAVERILISSPCSRLIAFAASDEDPCLFDALQAGAIGFVTPEMPLDGVAGILRSAAIGETVLPADFARRILDRLQPRRRFAPTHVVPRELTDRELEILRLLMRGLANAEIARKLGVSTNTVKNHLHSIYRKLGVTSRGQAFATATQLGIAS